MVTSSWILYISVFFLAFAAYVALLWVGATIVIPGILSGSCAECQAILLIITPQPISVLVFDGIPFLVYYIIIVVIITLCFFWLLIKDLPKAVEAFTKAMKRGGLFSSTKSTWTMLPQLFAFMIFFTVAYSLILILSGIDYTPTQIEARPLWYFLYAVAHAAVWEEIISRTLLIGVPLFVIAVIRYRRVYKPSRYFIGGGFKIGTLEGILLLFSALMFGAAHTYSGGIWVFAPTFVGGLILGYIFLKRGIAASILFHFVWNYSIAFTYMADVTGNTALLLVGGAFNLFLVFVGLALTVFYVGRMMGLFQTRKILVARREIPPTTEPEGTKEPTTPSLPSGFVCPRCGWMEATYKGRQFQCTRCGHII